MTAPHEPDDTPPETRIVGTHLTIHLNVELPGDATARVEAMLQDLRAQGIAADVAEIVGPDQADNRALVQRQVTAAQQVTSAALQNRGAASPEFYRQVERIQGHLSQALRYLEHP